MVGVYFQSTKVFSLNFVSNIFSDIPPKTDLFGGWDFLKLLFWGKGAASDFPICFGGQSLAELKIYFFIWGNLILNPNFFFLENPKIGHFIFISCVTCLILFHSAQYLPVDLSDNANPAFYIFWFFKCKALLWVSNLLRSMNVPHVQLVI